jgi:uncharacterized membrane protein
MGLILLIVLIVLLFGGLPNWGYHSYGYGPSGIVGTILIIVLILFLFGPNLTALSSQRSEQ